VELELTPQQSRWLIDSLGILHWWCRPSGDTQHTSPPFVVAGVVIGAPFKRRKARISDVDERLERFLCKDILSEHHNVCRRRDRTDNTILDWWKRSRRL